MKRLFGMITFVLLSVTMLFAHGNETHVMGTVTKASASSITVKDMHGKSVEVAINAATKFMKDNKAITANDLKEGDRVVIHAKQDGDKLEATMVKIGGMKADHMKVGDKKMGDMKGMDSNASPK